MLALAGRFCATERGRSRLEKTPPSGERDEVRTRAALTADLMTRAGLAPPVALGGLDEAAPLVARLGAGRHALPPEDLLDLFVLLERSEAARRAIAEDDGTPPLPALAGALAPLADFEDLLDERSVVFEPDGRIRDTATARLASIRASIVRLRRDVVRRLEELQRGNAEAFADTFVTEKGGRYCLPVRTDRRDRVAGIVHEKSGSGQTLFVEPLAVVEANNALAEALEEEREEILRILTALTAKLSLRREELEVAVETLTDLDAAQARAEFSRRIDGVFPEEADDVVLVGARHPLLDRRLGTLREEAFGEKPEERGADAVPLDIEIRDGRRLLLLSGPNAGGKTVAMKTVGLAALLSQSGFAVPAAAGTRLPVFDDVLVVAGDAQDLLGDLSSFAAAMTRTARVLARATKRSLVLLDELGSGTDPDEGGALAIGILEHALSRAGAAVATTHLSAVKEWGHARPDVLSAAMEFDEERGRPTFRVRPGDTGRSRAFAVALRAGIPGEVLEAARGRLGSAWAALEDARERLERETVAARVEHERARRLLAEAEEKGEAAERERAVLASERAALREKAKASLDRAVEALRESTRRELDKLREEARSGRAIAKGALTTITQTARAEAVGLLDVEERTMARAAAVGDRVRIEPFRSVGVVRALDAERDSAEVEVSGKRMRVKASDLAVLSGPAPEKRPVRRPADEPRAAAAPPAAGKPATAEVVLVGLRVDPALAEVERTINEALLAGKGSVRVVHGFGTGRLAAAVREFLAEHPGVAAQRPGDAREGGEAVTIAELDV